MSPAPPPLTLYLAPGACSLAPHILLHELHLTATTHLMTFTPTGVAAADGTLSAAAYRATVNAAGTVPTLTTTEGTLTESPAIMSYLATLGGDETARRLLGTTAWERGRVTQWLCWLSGTLHGGGYGMLLRPGRFAREEGAHEAIMARGREKIAECYAQIEAGLEGDGPYAVGGRFTAADASLYVFWGWGHRHGFEMNERYPKYGKLVKVVEQMNSVRAALDAEGQPLQFPSS